MALDLYDLILYEAQHAAAEYNQVYRPEAAKKKEALFEVVTRLQARACLIASEVRSLLVSVHSEGATARWRSIHEVLVVTLLITEHGPELAERYLLHDIIQTLSNINVSSG